MIRLKGGKVYDPANKIDGKVMDLYLHDGLIRHRANGESVSETIDVSGMIVMAGAIDMHTHIGGGKHNLARLLLPEDRQKHDRTPYYPGMRAGGGHAVPTAPHCGYRYAEMGYTSCFEPAMLPANSRHVHLEFSDIPIVDKGAYVLLGNDDFFLNMLAHKAEQQRINDYIAWTINAYRAMAIKVVNPGGINAFKYGQRQLDLDIPNRHYDLTPRDIVLALSRGVNELGLAHPVHLHGCNLGVPGNVESTLKTIEAVEGLRLHLTHLQFHSYGTEGPRAFSSAACQLADVINKKPNISVDVGQVMFGQTITASGDNMHQYAARKHGDPKRWLCMDIECDAGCGVVPFNYHDATFAHAMQWCTGLELFLLLDDPWRVFLTTDHPNGAPFATYPQLIRLLMDRDYRNEQLELIHPLAQQHSVLAEVKREYSLYEIAILTRAGPARSLGMSDHGHLGEGAAADITVYRSDKNVEEMFSKPAYVFKWGELVARQGRITALRTGYTHRKTPEYDNSIVRELRPYFQDTLGRRLDNVIIGDEVDMEPDWQEVAPPAAYD